MKISIVYNGAQEKEKKIVNYLRRLELKADFLDISNQNLRVIKEATRSDSFLFLLPEEGENKELMSFLKYSNEEIRKKPTGIISYSNHLNFNKEALDSFTLSLLSIQAFPVKINVRMIISPSGILENGDLDKLLKEIKWWSKVLKAEKLNSKLTVRIKKTNNEDFSIQNADNIDLLLGTNYWKN